MEWELEGMGGLRESFELLFKPKSIAFVGASNNPDKWGFRILLNLIRGGFEGKIYPVNLKEREILGLSAYPGIKEIPEVPELAVIVVPPTSVIEVLRDSVEKGIKAGVVITAGFAEIGREGEKLQKAMAELTKGRMLVVGPNCNGIMNPSIKLYSVMPPIFPPPGPVAVISQSGNVATSIVRRITCRGLGLSKYVSSGNEAVLTYEDYLEYLADDPGTKVILLYIEGIRDGGRFLRVAREVNRKKPVVVLKGGETPEGAKAAFSHTASLAGSDILFDALCRQSGIVRARDIDELIVMGTAFLDQPLPKGRRVGIITGGGGWGVLAADACSKMGLEVTSLPENVLSKLDKILPPWWNRGNPVDLVAGTEREAVLRCAEILLKCPAIDALIILGIVPILPQELTRPIKSDIPTWRNLLKKEIPNELKKFFKRIKDLISLYRKPIFVASEIPFADLDLEGRISSELGRINSVCYASPHEAVLALSSLVRRSEALRDDQEHKNHHPLQE